MNVPTDFFRNFNLIFEFAAMSLWPTGFSTEGLGP